MKNDEKSGKNNYNYDQTRTNQSYGSNYYSANQQNNIPKYNNYDVTQRGNSYGSGYNNFNGGNRNYGPFAYSGYNNNNSSSNRNNFNF